MAKLKLVANPTFKAKVGIPLAGGDAVDVEMTFKHRTKSALLDWMQVKDRTDLDAFMDMVEGWDLEDEFGSANVELLLENYIGAASATFQVYCDQLIQAKQKN